MIKTPICDLLGIEYPIFQGGMAWIADGKLAAAVSEGGGLGIIAAGNASANYVREQIHIVRQLTDRPFGVNVMLMSPSVNEVAAVLAEEKVPVITTGAGNPGKHMKAWKAAGCKVIPVVASVAMAKLMTRLGASALIAEGGESGGHVGELTTMVLVPQVCDATTLPVLAAGGIADGRRNRRRLYAGGLRGPGGHPLPGGRGVLGPPSLQGKNPQGQRHRHHHHRQAPGASGAQPETPFSRDYAKAEFSPISDEELSGRATGALRLAAKEGDVEHGCFLAGQVAGMIRREQPAAEIIREMFDQAEPILKGACQWVE